MTRTMTGGCQCGRVRYAATMAGDAAYRSSPLAFRYLGSDQLDLTVGSFDDPGFFRPTEHVSTETMLPRWVDTGHLPDRRRDAYRPLVEKWEQAVGAFPG